MRDESFKERRRYIRFDNLNINFKTKEIDKIRGPENIVQAVAINMNAEGICFISNAKLKPGTIIELDIFIPSQPKPVHLEGEVRWSNPVRTEEGREMFNTGMRLFIPKTEDTKFLLYICDRMQERIKELEKELGKTTTS